MAYNQKIMRMKELIEKLTEADIAYYKNRIYQRGE